MTPELELLSSTSDATSELWTEEGVVRQAGHAKILEMIVYEPKSTGKVSSQDEIELKAPSQVRIGDLGEAYDAGVLKLADEGRSKMFKDVFGKLSFKFRKQSQVLAPSGNSELQAGFYPTRAAEARARQLPGKLASQPPNLLFNVQNALPKSRELWTFAIIGLALQCVAVAIPAVMTYHWRKLKGTNPVQDYAYPTFLVGTYLLVLGIALCSFTIETATVEQTFTPAADRIVKEVFWLQLQQNMGDQPFKAYVLVKRAGDKKIRTSRYWPEETDKYSHDSRPEYQEPTVIFAVGLCFTGFICQFVGLRALHWSATVTQLGITLLMTCIRAWIRRGISNQPISFHLKSNPNWIALSVGTACQGSWPDGGVPWSMCDSPKFLPWYLPGGIGSMPSAGLITVDDPRIVLRRKLQSLSSKDDGDVAPISKNLRRAMYKLLDHFGLNYDAAEFTEWTHVVVNSPKGSGQHYVRLKLTGLVDETTLHALLALWRYAKPHETTEICVAQVFSEKDWITKISFLDAHIEAEVPGRLFLGNGRMAPPFGSRSPMIVSMLHGRYYCTGLSIERIHNFNFSAEADANRPYGYLVVAVGMPIAHLAFELLSGFMDALWMRMNISYDDEARNWSAEGGRGIEVFGADTIVKMLMDTGLVATEKDAKVLVISSLARCTVWKDPPGSDGPTSMDDQDSNSPSPTVSTTRGKIPPQEQSESNASGRT
ncbi:uncharacterized protein J4E87_006434 [Alternaria ethzedia]|uniref:uncharacterized protein n=1 Tax=Alternaria ethzedia TaxID=181014 RepID=UPI0020C35DFA|nr:uncharacterized protein J4E87_006434 [Alternaria ethzedia]KAI4622492.1 hypothetical protein J4E87_006434 [Alternaria ethzedia]